MQKLIFSILFSSLALNAISQSKESISVKLEVLAKGRPSYIPSYYNYISDECYQIRLEITNNEDTTLPITFWNCSWYWNWKSNSDSVYIFPWGCDGNFPEAVNVPSKSTLVFCVGVYAKSFMKGKEFKIGFSNCWEDFINADYRLTFSNKSDGKLYWSNSIMLKDSYPVVNNYFHDFLVVCLQTKTAANMGLPQFGHDQVASAAYRY